MPDMRRIKQLLSVLCILASAIAHAGITFTPHPGEPAPGYFSGANCRVSYKADVSYPDVHIQAAQLYIGGDLTISETYAIIGFFPKFVYHNEQSFAVMFDATHCTTMVQDTPVEIKMRVEAGGVWYEDSYTAHALTFARSFGRNDFENATGGDGALQADRELWSIYYGDSLVTTLAWKAADVSSELDAYTNLIYFNTHGDPHVILTDYDEAGVGPDPIYAYYSDGTPDFADWRAASIGTGLPPFNSTGKPAINLAQFNTCLSGADNAFEALLYPYYNGYGWLLENQAEGGYSVSIYTADSALLTTILFHDLVTGMVFGDAGFDLIEGAIYDEVHVVDTSETDRLIQSGNYHVYGDPNTRIHEVYTGDATDVGWWRRL